MSGDAGAYQVLGPKAVSVEWRLGDDSRLLLLANFADEPVPVPDNFAKARPIYSSAEPGAPHSASFFLIDSTQVASSR
jgi:Domain of unknown function (DUF3459)